MTGTRQVSSTPAGAAAVAALEFIRLRIRPWLHTREGSASTIVAVLLTVIAWGFADARFTTAVLAGMFGVVLVSLAARFWEVRTAPPVPPFAHVSAPLPGTIEVLEDENAGFWRDKSGFLWSHRVWFAGTGCEPRRLKPGTYGCLRLWHDEGQLPVFVARAGQRQCWWWQAAFYWESGDYEPEDMHALLTLMQSEAQVAQNDSGLAAAHPETGYAHSQNGHPHNGNGDKQPSAENGTGLACLEWEIELRFAAPIPEEVKRLVFDRDGGRCVQCGSPDLLQFDHILPFLQGGGNETANLRLLCAGCNRHPTSVIGLGCSN